MALMDIGPIGNEDIVFKRKFRWTLYFSGDGGQGFTEAWMAKLANRPTLNIEETEINHLHEKHWLSGKPTWDSVGVTLYDVKRDGSLNSASTGEQILHQWLNTAWNISTNTVLQPPNGYDLLDMGDHDAEYKRNLTIKMHDGHGSVMETWWLIGAWPQSVNWGDLDYASSDTADVEFTVRFDRAQFFPGNADGNTGGAENI